MHREISKMIKKLSAILLMLAASLFISNAFAALDTQDQALINKGEKVIKENAKAVQNFNLEGFAQLKTQFRYVNGKLKTIYLYNSGTPVELSLLDQKQILGRGDDWEVRAPNVERIILFVDAYEPEIAANLDNPFIERSFIFSRSQQGLYELHSAFLNGRKQEK